MATNYGTYPGYAPVFQKVQKLSVQVYGYDGYSNGLDDSLNRIANSKGEDSVV